MRKLRVFEHVSLDGVISPGDPGEYSDDFANGGWTAAYRTPDGMAAVLAAQGERFDLLLGRRTYDLWAGYWPKAASSPMADRLNAAIKHVATRRPESLRWGPVQALGPNLVEDVRRLKGDEGPDLILWGSATLTSPLLDEGLVDEVVLIVYPVLLGRGKRFVSDRIGPSRLTLSSTLATPTGVLMNTYRVAGPMHAS